MGEFHCDRCQGPLLVHEDVRYKLRIEVASVYDTMELNPHRVGPLERKEEFRRLLKVIEQRTEQELHDEVYKAISFDLCGGCQRAFLRDPLGLDGPIPPPQDSTDPDDPDSPQTHSQHDR